MSIESIGRVISKITTGQRSPNPRPSAAILCEYLVIDLPEGAGANLPDP